MEHNRNSWCGFCMYKVFRPMRADELRSKQQPGCTGLAGERRRVMNRPGPASGFWPAVAKTSTFVGAQNAHFGLFLAHSYALFACFCPGSEHGSVIKGTRGVLPTPGKGDVGC